ncbi:hypothetical protein VIN01S_36410 [Vibrio inusitatus NBRC 102082]|uniref:Uncharacterized protein n=1 Tax=Vibrio inusitatus NBRC 102082 TaxID=1219070 RepID=A0A4Y3I091_9VIBR|nr:hypothetical protein VIN01S_36410 [Vibrio inusitatus NBRC 102082]
MIYSSLFKDIESNCCLKRPPIKAFGGDKVRLCYIDIKFEVSFIAINHKLSFPSAPIGNLMSSIGVEILDKSTRG